MFKLHLYLKGVKMSKKEALTIEKLNNLFEDLGKNGISFDTKFCDRKHAYVIHCWIDEEYKCNLFARTLKWVPFGFHKGKSGQGIAELKHFLLNGKENFKKKKEYSYKEKYEALRDVLMQVRNEYNFDIIDEVLREYA